MTGNLPLTTLLDNAVESGSKADADVFFKALFKRKYNMLYIVAYRFATNKADVRDIVSSYLMKLVSKGRQGLINLQNQDDLMKALRMGVRTEALNYRRDIMSKKSIV